MLGEDGRGREFHHQPPSLASLSRLPRVPRGCRVLKVPNDRRSSLSEAVPSKLWRHPRGFRHGRKAGRCRDPLRNVTP